MSAISVSVGGQSMHICALQSQMGCFRRVPDNDSLHRQAEPARPATIRQAAAALRTDDTKRISRLDLRAHTMELGAAPAV
jgi:hypothetical protein